MDIWKALAGAEAEAEDAEAGSADAISFGASGGGGRKRVGQLLIVPRFQVWAGKGIEPHENGVMTPPTERRDFDSGSFLYWPVTQLGPASAMQKIVRPDSRFDPTQVILLDMQAATFLNWPLTAGDPKNVLTNVEVARSFPALTPPKNDAEEKRRWRGIAFHLMFLPSLVQGVAVAAGLLPKALYEYGSPGVIDLEEADEDIFAKMVGSKDEPGELVEARTAIWAALGEEKVAKWSADAQGKVTNITPGTPLHNIVRHLLYRVAPEALWCEMAPYTVIPDPAAIDKNSRAILAPVVTRVWQTDAEARVYAQTMYPDSAAAGEGSSLRLPNAFVSAGVSEAQFATHLKGLLAKPVFVGKSSDQVLAWLETKKGEQWIADEGMESAEVAAPWIEKVMAA